MRKELSVNIIKKKDEEIMHIFNEEQYAGDLPTDAVIVEYCISPLLKDSTTLDKVFLNSEQTLIHRCVSSKC